MALEIDSKQEDVIPSTKRSFVGFKQMTRVVVIDYGMGNLHSVSKALGAVSASRRNYHIF